MELTQFLEVKKRFALADTEGKIDIYLDTEDLTQTQYRELLLLFPREELDQLERAMH